MQNIDTKTREIVNNLNRRLNLIRARAAQGRNNEVQDQAFFALSDLNGLINHLDNRADWIENGK
jgi:hypothetical protein